MAAFIPGSDNRPKRWHAMKNPRRFGQIRTLGHYEVHSLHFSQIARLLMTSNGATSCFGLLLRRNFYQHNSMTQHRGLKFVCENTGGFWSLISAVQTPGALTLPISHLRSRSSNLVFWAMRHSRANMCKCNRSYWQQIRKNKCVCCPSGALKWIYWIGDSPTNLPVSVF